jgi:hypothetical protein
LKQKGQIKRDFAKVAAAINPGFYWSEALRNLCPSEAVKEH